MLKVFRYVALAGLLVVPSLAAVAQEAHATGPKLDVPQKVKDFGTVPQGKVIEATFQLANEGTGTLEVRAVRPTCGCTVVDFDRKVEPGKTGLVKAKVDTAEFTGPITKSMLVMTNDPNDPTTTLVVKATVQPYLEILPRPLVRFNAIQGEAASNDVTLVADKEREFKVTKVEANVPYLTASVKALGKDELVPDKGKTQYDISINLAPNAPVGPVNGMVTVFTDYPEAPQVKVRVFGVVRALVHVTPGNIEFGTVESKVKPGRNVFVVNNQEKPIHVTGAKIDDDAFTVGVLPIEAGKRYQITVTVKAEAPAGLHKTVLHINTDDPKFSDLQVQVAANLK
jgi:Protein of unknown function (DUF1573)